MERRLITSESRLEAQPQNKIAIVSDFDKTLSPGSFKPLADYLGIDEKKYFDDINKQRYIENKKQLLERREREELQLPESLRASLNSHRYEYAKEVAYINPLLRMIWQGESKPVTRKILRELGEKVDFYPGVPDFIPEMKTWVKTHSEWSRHDISLEFYVISSGIAEILRGSKVSKHCDGIFALELYADDIESMTDPVTEIGSPMTFTDKTQFIHRIHKGFDVGVNDYVPQNMRRIAGNCIIYIGDGPTDVPCMSTVNVLEGQCFAVYKNDNVPIEKDKSFEAAYRLREQGRVIGYGGESFEPGEQTRKSLEMAVSRAAKNIIERKMQSIRKHTGLSVGF